MDRTGYGKAKMTWLVQKLAANKNSTIFVYIKSQIIITGTNFPLTAYLSVKIDVDSDGGL